MMENVWNSQDFVFPQVLAKIKRHATQLARWPGRSPHSKLFVTRALPENQKCF